MSVFGYAAAGALQGLGTGLKEQAVARRESALEKLRYDRQLKRDEDDRTFRREEREASQNFQRQMTVEKDELAKQTATAKDASGVTRYVASGEPVFEADRKQPGQMSAAQSKLETDLRKEYDAHAVTKSFDKFDENYRKIRASAEVKNPTGADDVSLIYGFMKMLDPGSAVMEGEFANAKNAAGIPDKVRTMYNNAVAGEVLAPRVRENFVRTAQELYDQATVGMKRLNDRYRSIAESQQLNVDRVVRELPTYSPLSFSEAPAGNSNPKNVPAVGEDGWIDLGEGVKLREIDQ